MIIIVLIFIMLIVIISTVGIKELVNNSKRQKEEYTYISSSEEVTEENQQDKYKNVYQPKYLMTINEKAQYRKIQKWAERNNLIVFSKVRLLDLITPRNEQRNNKGALWKIQAKHVDFVICDKDIRVKCIIEINDKSHNRQDRTERDNFVTEVLQSCGYKVLMTYNATEEQLNQICGYNQSTIDEQKPPFSV